MDRRFFTWLMLTTALCFLYLSMRPVPQPQDKGDQANAADPLQNDPLAPLPNADQGQADPTEETDGDAPAVVQAAERPAYPRRTVTLGSMDPEKGYKLLVTISSQGASVEKAELVAQPEPGRFQYRALEHRGGYLGYLGLSGGAEIRTVPDGSPAALAQSADSEGGLRAGDVLVSVSGQPVDSLASLNEALKDTEPGQTVSVVIERAPASNSDQAVQAEAATPNQIDFSVVLSEAPLDVLRSRERDAEAIIGNLRRPSFLTTLASLNGTSIPVGARNFPSLSDTFDANWETRELPVQGGQGVEFRLPLDGILGTQHPRGLSLVKRYRLMPADGPDGYLLDLETVIENGGNQSVRSSFRQEGPAGLTLEGWWYSVKISPYMFSAAGQRDVVYNTEAESHLLKTTRQIQSHAKSTPAQPSMMLFSEGEPPTARNIRYMGVDSQYFNASLLPHPQQPEALSNLRQAAATSVANVDAVEKSKIQATNTSFWFDTPEQEIPGGGQLAKRYSVFIGPKDSDVLAEHGLDRAIEYGWFPWIAKPLSAILHFFHAIVGNYGLAIVMLTLVVRGFMFPLGRKAAANAQRMQELQPEMKRINEKYKDSMERAKAMQELYAKHNFKPLAGCLPMFIQLPIFIGLYRCLSVDVSLRQEPLLQGMTWCSNLAGPDMFIDWSSWMPAFIAGKGSGWLGPYFNLLPIATVVLFILQQKLLMPKATDEQTRMTQNMMQVMTVFMGVLFFKVPAGLCIYFITSSLWSLLERKLVKKTLPASRPSASASNAKDKPSGSPASGKNGSASSARKKRRNSGGEDNQPKGRLEEWKQMLEKPAVRSSTQRGPAPKKKQRRKKR